MAAGETETGRGSHDGDEEMRTWKGGGLGEWGERIGTEEEEERMGD